jgi:pseudaminic acid cytidylyltransferase
VQRSFLIDNNNKSVMLYPEKYAMQSQDLEPVYYDVGGFYIASRDCWLSGDTIFGNGVTLTLDKFKAIDINTEDDWLHAEHIAKSFYPNL